MFLRIFRKLTAKRHVDLNVAQACEVIFLDIAIVYIVET